MSSSNRTTAKGGKGAKGDKTHKTDKSDTGKGGGDKHPGNAKSEDHPMKDKVKQLMDLSMRSEEEVCSALHECDFDMQLASNLLLEDRGHGEWETRVKKKKNRQLSTSKQDKTDEVGGGAQDDWDDTPGQGSGGGAGGNGNHSGGPGNEKDKSRNKSGNGPPRLHGRHNDSRGWRGREKHENDRNMENGGRTGGGGDFQRGERRGRPGGGSMRGGGGGRGRGGGRAGGRYPPRGSRSGGGGGGGIYKSIDTWDNSNTWDNNTAAETNHNTSDNWDDFPGADEWTTEEYQGSLADTKVFTSSVPPNLDPMSEQGGQPGLDPNIAAGVGQQVAQGSGAQMGQPMPPMTQPPVQMPSQSPVPMVGTLNAAQTQYLTQLTQQNSDSMNKQYASTVATQYQPAGTSPAGVGSQVYSSGTGGTAGGQYGNAQYNNAAQSNAYVNNNFETGYGAGQEQVTSQQPPVRTKTQRARVPPPSKIPSSAVEMPGDLNTSIGYLDVQFGGMDLIDNSSFDGGVNDGKFGGGSANTGGGNSGVVTGANTTPLECSATSTAAVNNLDLNSSSVQNTSLDGYSPKMNPQSSISSPLSQSTSEHLTGVYAAATAAASRSQTGSGSGAGGVQNSQTPVPSGLDISKSSDSQSYSQSSTYNSYQPKSNTYNSTTYSAPPTTSTYASNQSNSYSNQATGTYNPSTGNTYPNSYSSTTSSYQSTNSSGFPSISQANTYPQNNQTYPQNTSQSVYSGNTGLSNSNYGNTSTSQYNSYSASANSHKLNKESSYENNSSVASSSQTTTTNSVTSSASLTMSQTTSTSKTTTTLVAKTSNNVVSNIPPGVAAPVISTPYIMGQMPFYQPPITYSFEEVQLLQQRMPHMTPTTLAAVRDGTLSNVGYSISDGRFTRGDNNASPVPSTLSQQTSTMTQGQAQPILTAGTAPPYFFAPFNTIPNYHQFGTMYTTQLPAATNAHGTSNSNQYPKPTTYGSGYGGYETLNQTQDYSKGSYVSNTQGPKTSGGNASSTGSTGTDLSAMYGAKSHTALGKVNSYEKQGFHSGTPPPFTGTLHGNQNAGLTPSGTSYGQVYLQMPPHGQHHSTQLIHQPHHQDSGNSSGPRSQSSNQVKSGTKPTYQPSYWNQA